MSVWTKDVWTLVIGVALLPASALAQTIYPDELPSYSPGDAAAAIQQAIGMNPSKIVLRANTPWVIGSQIEIINRNNLEIYFEPNALVEAKAGAFQDRTHKLFWIQDSTGITLNSSGPGATLKMRKADYMDPGQYAPSEHRHIIAMGGANDVTLRHLTLRDSGGDGIYITGGTTQEFSRNITVEHILADNNFRQGMSVISVDGLRVRDSEFSNTTGIELGVGIDFEPNRPSQQLTDIVVSNVLLQNNRYRAFTISTSKLDSTSQPVSIRIENAEMVGGDHGIYIGGPDTGRTGSVVFDGGTIRDTRLAGILGLTSSVVDPSGLYTLRNSVRNIKLTNVATETNGDELAHPVVFHTLLTKRSGGIDFMNVAIDDQRNRPFLFSTSAAQFYGAGDIHGDFIVNNPNGAHWNLGPDKINIDVVDSVLRPFPMSVRKVMGTGFESPTFGVGANNGGFGEPVNGIDGSATNEGRWSASNSNSEQSALPHAVTVSGYGINGLAGNDSGLRLRTSSASAITASVDIGTDLVDGIVTIMFDARRDFRGFFFGGYSTEQSTRNDPAAAFGIHVSHTNQWVYLDSNGVEQSIPNGVIAAGLGWGQYTISLDLEDATYNVLIDNGTDFLSLNDVPMNFTPGVDVLRFLQFHINVGQGSDVLFDNLSVYHTTSLVPEPHVIAPALLSLFAMSRGARKSRSWRSVSWN